MMEKHPWTKFPEENQNSTKLILGSFPPNKFTVRIENMTQCDMDFFYGSKDNYFWQLFSDAMGLNYKFPDDLNNLKNYLVEKNWIVSDIVLECTRNNDTAYDTDLRVSKWNESIINEIIKNNPIETIYFNSK